MNGIAQILSLAVVLALAVPALAGPYEQAFGAVQRMLTQSARNDETGLQAARQQLEQMPRPAHQDVKAARALNQQGLDALKRGDAAAAVTALQQAQRADPADVEVAGNLGYAHLKLGQLKRAEQQLIYALSLAPDRVSSWFNLGQVYGALNQPEKATGAFANTYRFAQNRIKTEGFLRQALQNPENSAATRTALRQALALFGLSVDGS